uniref:Serine/threonine protein kinase n=1 Tax=Solibacter usitatus (strain Ellin6076) TaxID=234267 RepID=Q023R7_SOLUE
MARATDTKLNRDVAIKVLPEAFARDSGRIARFQNEARILASLNHPNSLRSTESRSAPFVLELGRGRLSPSVLNADRCHEMRHLVLPVS